MSNIVKHENSFTDIMSIGKAFAESGMFADIKSAAQAVVKITAGAEMGIPPFASMSGIHIIQGKPTIGAGLLAARVKGSGKYNYKVVEQSEKVCVIDFYEGAEKIGTSKFTIEDAKKAQTKNLDKFPANMLFARAMSNGVKWFTPDLFAGPVYVPGEIEPVVEETTAEVVEQPTPFDQLRGIAHALESLEWCETEADLQQWKKSLPKDVLKNPTIVGAATEKYNALTKPKEVANV
jgi:hypothetical protein